MKTILSLIAPAYWLGRPRSATHSEEELLAAPQGSTPSGATQQRSTPNGATQQGSTPSGAQQGGAAQFGSGVIIGPGNGEHRVEERDRIRSDRSRDDLTTQTYVVPSEKTGDKTSVGGVRCWP